MRRSRLREAKAALDNPPPDGRDHEILRWPVSTEELGPIGDAVLDELIECGLAKRRFALLPMPVK